jgi:hypothetical protein
MTLSQHWQNLWQLFDAVLMVDTRSEYTGTGQKLPFANLEHYS